MKALKILLAGMAVLGLLIFAASPYWALYQINQAYQHNDAARMSQYINFAEVKASLKPQIQQKMNAAAGLEHLPEGLQPWGAQLSHSISSHAVDAAVNEQTIFLLMQGKGLKESIQLSLSKNREELSKLLLKSTVLPDMHGDERAMNTPPKIREMADVQPESSSGAQHPSAKAKPRMHAHYTGWNSFEIAVPNDSGSMTRFKMQRSQLSWKITAIELPNSK